MDETRHDPNASRSIRRRSARRAYGLRANVASCFLRARGCRAAGAGAVLRPGRIRRRMAAIGSRSRSRPISGCPRSAPRQASAGCRSMTSASTGRRPALPKSSTHCMALSSATGSALWSVVDRARHSVDRCLPKRSLPANAIGPAVTLQEDASVFRIAPGLGYQIYSGAIAGVRYSRWPCRFLRLHLGRFGAF